MPEVARRLRKSPTKLEASRRCRLQETGGPGRTRGAGTSGQAGRWPGPGATSLQVMLALAVPTQVHLALEALGAELAAEGLEARVLPAVGDEVGALAEGLPTHLALVRLLTCVWGGRGGRRWVRAFRAGPAAPTPCICSPKR